LFSVGNNCNVKYINVYSAKTKRSKLSFIPLGDKLSSKNDELISLLIATAVGRREPTKIEESISGRERERERERERGAMKGFKRESDTLQQHNK
jgi:hypothetical protein